MTFGGPERAEKADSIIFGPATLLKSETESSCFFFLGRGTALGSLGFLLLFGASVLAESVFFGFRPMI